MLLCAPIYVWLQLLCKYLLVICKLVLASDIVALPVVQTVKAREMNSRHASEVMFTTIYDKPGYDDFLELEHFGVIRAGFGHVTLHAKCSFKKLAVQAAHLRSFRLQLITHLNADDFLSRGKPNGICLQIILKLSVQVIIIYNNNHHHHWMSVMITGIQHSKHQKMCNGTDVEEETSVQATGLFKKYHSFTCIESDQCGLLDAWCKFNLFCIYWCKAIAGF